MPEGLVRRLLSSLGGILLLLGLPGAGSFSRPSPRSTWWEVKLTVAVKGGYTFKGGGAPVSGEYTCRARWEGSLEVDGVDFLLYHLRTEVLEWRLAEKTARPGGESVLEEKDRTVKPALRLNYILKDGPDIEIDFDLMGIPVPLHDFPVKVALELPSSEVRRPRLLGSSYTDHVSRGSSRVVIPGSDLERRAAERTFSWEWRRERPVGAGACLVTERHSAEVVVSLVAH